MLKSRINNHIILALDVVDVDRATKVAAATREFVDAIKIGLPLGLTRGLRIVSRIREVADLPMIADIKIGDIPEIAGRLSRICFDLGFDAMTIHGFIGPTAIEESVKESKGVRDVIVMTETTHPDAEIFMQPVSEDIAQMAKDVGATGIQAPGTRPERVKRFRQIVGDDMLIVSCGIGAQGGKIGGAIEAGADLEIIGRMIYDAESPRRIAKKISDQLKR